MLVSSLSNNEQSYGRKTSEPKLRAAVFGPMSRTTIEDDFNRPRYCQISGSIGLRETM
jgi:hypothetical protein